MKPLSRLILLVFLVLPVFAEDTKEQQEALKKTFPWIFDGDVAFRYETISTEEIHAYCSKQQLEMSVWHEEYIKRYGEIEQTEIPENEKRPENGMFSGMRALQQLNVTYYINKRAAEGWKLVGASQDFLIFEKSEKDKEKKE